jgi:putative peptidoglycan lipid II flippase
VVLYNYGWQMFFAAYAVLAIPIAVSAFPVLSARAGADPGRAGSDRAEFDATAAASTRAVLLVSWLGAALLVGAAVPLSRLFAAHSGQATELALALAAFAPGLVGFGLVACLSRVLLADGRIRAAAAAMAGGWLIVIVADVIAVEMVSARWVVPVLGLGNTAGMVVSGAALLTAVRRARGGDALHGTVRAAMAGLAGAVVGAAAGAGMSAAVPVSGFFLNALVALLACCCAVIAFGVIAYALDGGDLRALVARARRRAVS